MKKILSILMLFVMLVIGAHPTLAMHFCEENLHSVHILSQNENNHNKACCPPIDNTANNLAAIDSSFGGADFEKKCCETKKLEISTDTYQHQERQFNMANILPSFEHMWLMLNYTSIPELEQDSSLSVLEYFPPDGLSVQHSNILFMICTYII